MMTARTMTRANRAWLPAFMTCLLSSLLDSSRRAPHYRRISCVSSSAEHFATGHNIFVIITPPGADAARRDAPGVSCPMLIHRFGILVKSGLIGMMRFHRSSPARSICYIRCSDDGLLATSFNFDAADISAWGHLLSWRRLSGARALFMASPAYDGRRRG